MTDQPRPQTRKHRPAPKPSDFMTTSDIAEEMGWTVVRAESFVRALVRDGVELHSFRGFSRNFIRRADLEARKESWSGRAAG